MNELLTIFTPVYNREDKIINLYESLVKQTCKDFVWIIIDDGSVDNTLSIIKKFKNEQSFKVIIFHQKNHGKHVAHNHGVKVTKTELFVCVDSDDTLVEDAVEEIINFYNKNKDIKNKNIAGIIAWKGYSKSRKIGSYPSSINTSSLIDLYNNRGMTGDTMLIFKTAVIKEYPFPVFKGERFLRESISYNKIDKKYKYLILNKILYIADYYDDGLSKNATKLEKQSPLGAALFRWDEYKHSKKMKTKIRNLIAFTYFNRIGKNNFGTIKKVGFAFIPLWILSFIGNIYYK